MCKQYGIFNWSKILNSNEWWVENSMSEGGAPERWEINKKQLGKTYLELYFVA